MSGTDLYPLSVGLLAMSRARLPPWEVRSSKNSMTAGGLVWSVGPVESIDTHEFNVVVSFGRGTALTIESVADVQASPRQPGTPAVSMNQDGSVFASNALLSLAGQRVVSGVAFKTGALRLVFESAARLTVPFGEEHEAWQLTGPSGRLWVSLPCGGLATFPGTQQ